MHCIARSLADGTAPPAPSQRFALPSAWLAIALPFAQFMAIFLSMRLRLPGLWIVNAFLLVALLRSRIGTWPALVALAAVADAAAWATVAPGLARSINVTADMLVPLLIAIAVRRFAKD